MFIPDHYIAPHAYACTGRNPGILWKSMSDNKPPFIGLGNHLKYVREQLHQSLAEVSGAVEIDETKLAKIEAGEERPSEDILLLLISHFGVQDQEAVQLWQLADYDHAPDQLKADADAVLGGKPTVMILAMDMRTQYSDGVEIVSNQAGVTLNFTQQSGPNQANSVARVGMSHDQAELLLKTLQTVLLQHRYQSGPKQLPPASD